MVMAENPVRKQTHVLIRGAYDKPGETVEPGIPSVLPPLPAGAANNRLGFAKWLVAPENPLLARVTVNRFWQMYFGTGIVKTVEDLGAQGEWPSHPELLDWLATEFVRTGWDVKAHAEAVCDERDIPAIVGIQAGAGGAGSREPPVLARAAFPPARGNHPRPGAFRRRAVDGKIGRAFREAIPAGRSLERAGDAGHGLRPEQGPGSLSPQPVHILEAHHRAAHDDEFRFRPARDLCGARDPNRHAAAGAEPDERRDFRGGRAIPRAAHDEGRRRATRMPVCAMDFVWHSGARRRQRNNRSCETTCDSTWIISRARKKRSTPS